MKCDVCGTKIPLGSYECPNCGFRYKNENDQSFHTVSSTHEHIRVPIRNKTTYSTPKRTGQNLGERLRIIKILMIFTMSMIIIGAFVFSIMTVPVKYNSYNELENMTFEEILDAGYDDGTVKKAMEKYEEVKELMIDSLGINEFYTDHLCDQFEDYIYASFIIEGTKDGVTYGIRCYFNGEQESYYDLNISGSSKISIMESSEMPIDKDIVNKIGNYMRIDDAYEQINRARLEMTYEPGSDNRKVYQSYLGPSIYLSESQYMGEYGFSCSLTQ